MNCKSKKEHLVGDAVHGIIVSVDKVDNINDKKANFVKKGSQCTFEYQIYCLLIMWL